MACLRVTANSAESDNVSFCDAHADWNLVDKQDNKDGHKTEFKRRQIHLMFACIPLLKVLRVKRQKKKSMLQESAELTLKGFILEKSAKHAMAGAVQHLETKFCFNTVDFN